MGSPSTPNYQNGRVGVDAVVLALRRGQLNRAVDCVAQVDLTVQLIGERRRRRVLEIGHEHLGTRIQRVDDHLALDRAGDLDAAILQRGRDRGHGPVAAADTDGIGAEIGQGAGVVASLALAARLQQLLPSGIKPTM
jgi:hypothetical protein